MTCPDCNHEHASAAFGGICIGCPCPTVAPHFEATAVDIRRKAASTLRERAEAATPGPWKPTTGIAPSVLGPREPEDMGGGLASILRANLPLINGHRRREANVAHAAMMHPGVALALADWLDATMKSIDAEADALARLIVGES